MKLYKLARKSKAPSISEHCVWQGLSVALRAVLMFSLASCSGSTPTELEGEEAFKECLKRFGYKGANIIHFGKTNAVQHTNYYVFEFEAKVSFDYIPPLFRKSTQR